jgi:hypothetical protein
MPTAAHPDAQKSTDSFIGFKTTAELKNRLEEFRRQEGERSISDVCRRLLEHGLRDYAI